MNAQEINVKKYQGILDSISQVKLLEYNLMDYDTLKWEITFDEHPSKVNYIAYSRAILLPNFFKKIYSYLLDRVL